MDNIGISRKIPVTAIMDIKVNSHFVRMINELNPQSSMDVMDANEIGPHTAAILEEKIASGGLVMVTGDRTSMGGKNLMLPFLGKEAPFPSGIFYLATLMDAPIYFVFCLRRKDLAFKPEYCMYVHKSQLSFDCPRKERLKRSSLLVESFAALLTQHCKEKPFQWYNFYDFWKDSGKQV